MAKKRRVLMRVKDTSRPYPRIDPKKIAEALGAKIVTDPEEVNSLKRKLPPRRP